MKPEKKEVPVTFRITPDMARQLKRLAKERDWPLSLLLREGVKEYLAQQEKQGKRPLGGGGKTQEK